MIYRHTYLLTKSEGIGFFYAALPLTTEPSLPATPSATSRARASTMYLWRSDLPREFPARKFYDWTRLASHLAQVCVSCFFVLSSSERSKRWMLRFLFSSRYYWHLSTVKWEVCTRSCLSCVCALNLARLRACKSDENIVLPTTSSSTHGVVINFTLMCSKNVIQVHACFGTFSVVQ